MKVVSLIALAALSTLAPIAVVAETPATGDSANAAAPVMAVWVEQKIDFAYVGFTSHYSCDGLKSKVSSILKDIGARPDFKVTARACMNPRHGAEWTPILKIVAAMPQPATPEVLAEVAKDASQRELAARAGGKVSPAAEMAAQFPAQTRRVNIRDTPAGLVQPGDCELVEQLRNKVFVPLGATIVASHMDCMPHRINNGIIVLSIDVLEPVTTG